MTPHSPTSADWGESRSSLTIASILTHHFATWMAPIHALFLLCSLCFLCVSPGRYECGLHSNPAEFLSDLVGVDETSVSRREASSQRISSLIRAFAAMHNFASISSTSIKSPRDRSGVVLPLPVAPDALPVGEQRGKGFWEQFRILFGRAWKQVRVSL